LEEYFDISGWNDDIEWVKLDDGFKVAKEQWVIDNINYIKLFINSMSMMILNELNFMMLLLLKDE
jgi:hypothetical protein